MIRNNKKGFKPNKKQIKEAQPQYMFEGLPDPDMLPTKLFVAKWPENIDRPPPEGFNEILRHEYKKKYIKDRKLA